MLSVKELPENAGFLCQLAYAVTDYMQHASWHLTPTLSRALRQPAFSGCTFALILLTVGSQRIYMLPVVQITCIPTGGHGIISSHLPKWAKSSQAEAQVQDRSPVQGMLIINSQTMQPESLQPSPRPCMVAVAALQH